MAADSTKNKATVENPSEFRMRPIELSDAETVASWFQQIEDVSIFDRQLPLPINQSDAVSFIKTLVTDQENLKSKWFITETADGAATGMTGLESINMLHGNAILPMFVAEPWRRSGIGIRMACMMIDLAFAQLRLHRVATFYRADNAASGQLLKRLGFQEEGIARQAWFSQGQHFDLMNVAVLLNEWKQRRSTLLTELSPAVILELGPRASTRWCWPSRE